MSEDIYEVRVDGIPYATNISLEAAMVMVESLFKKWFAEPNLTFEILRITKSTNADRIRSMTDEELAKWLNDMQGYAYNCGLIEARISEYPNRNHAWLIWLKEEVKE